MKKTNCLLWLAFTAASVALRVWQNVAGYEETGLARRGFLPGLLLPVTLLAAAVCFVLLARSLPGRRADGRRLAADFRFTDNMPAVFCAVAGSFLVMIGGGLYAVSAVGSLMTMLLALLAVAAGGCTLYAVFALYRGGEAQGMALLVPVCASMAFLVLVYRANAVDPVLSRTYVEIVAVAALTFSASQRAAFVYGGSAPKRYVPLSAMSALLALTAATEGGGLHRAALLIGCAAVELGFLLAAECGD